MGRFVLSGDWLLEFVGVARDAGAARRRVMRAARSRHLEAGGVRGVELGVERGGVGPQRRGEQPLLQQVAGRRLEARLREAGQLAPHLVVESGTSSTLGRPEARS